jgi:PhnB protein
MFMQPLSEEVFMPTIPEGSHTLTPTLILSDAAGAIELYKKAFGAQEMYRLDSPDSSKVMHACIKIGDSRLFLSDLNPEMGCTTASVSNFYLYMDDVDNAFKQAKQAGLEEIQPVQDMFWGDRTGCMKDSFGNTWTIATHVRDVSPEEIKEAAKKMTSKAA